MARHFPCHGDDARQHASRLFYSRLGTARPAPRATPPAARRHHVAVSVGDEWVLVHGGEIFDLPPSQAVSGEVFLLHTPTLRWFQPPALWSSGTFLREFRLRGHTAVRLASGEVVLFGGLRENGATSDATWLLEI